MNFHKRIIPYILLVTVFLFGLFLLPTTARAEEEGAFCYEIIDGTAAIVGYNEEITGHLTVPATH